MAIIVGGGGNGGTINPILDKAVIVSGFDLDNPNTIGTLSYDNTTRVFSIAPVSGQSSFEFYVKNKKFTKTSADSVTLPSTTGYYYTYYDENGVLQYQDCSAVTDRHEFFKNTLVGAIYINVDTGDYLATDVRHGIKMDVDTRVSMLMTEGCKYVDGLDFIGLSANNNTYTQINKGNLFSQDKYLSQTSETTSHSFLYRLGNAWVKGSANNELAFKENTATYYQYNYYNTSTNEWELKEGANDSDFWIMFVVAVPKLNGGIEFYKILGQQAYSNVGNARDAILTELSRLQTDGLPFLEYSFLYAYIVKRNGVLKALADDSLIYDFRGVKGIGKTEDSLSSQAILDKLKEVDGSGSGLDADTVDGKHASDLADITYVDVRDAKLVDFISGSKDKYLEALVDGSGVKVLAGTIINLKGDDGIWRVYEFSNDTSITETALDTGTFTLGTDYYVYLTQSGDLVISANVTAPDGYTTDNTRKIGGFHYGRVRTIEQRFDKNATLSIQVIPNSVWDLRNRPKCPDPSGMVKVANFWVDIYLSSVDGTPWPNTMPLSRYNATPVTGAEGYCFADRAILVRNAGKRLPSYIEFLQYAYGTPEGSVGGSSRVPTGSVDWLVSCANVDQPSGNVWQVGEDIYDLGGTFGWASFNEGVDGHEQGAVYHANMRQILFGGDWARGSYSGSRCANLCNAPWDVDASNVGVRAVCDCY